MFIDRAHAQNQQIDFRCLTHANLNHELDSLGIASSALLKSGYDAGVKILQKLLLSGHFRKNLQELP